MLAHITQLQSCQLSAPLKRDHQALYTDHYANRTGEFDFNTLFYDIVQTQHQTLLYCPKLLNFEEILLKAKFLLDGIQQKINIQKFSRYDVIALSAVGKKLSIEHASINQSWDIQPFDQLRFKDKNCIVCMNKNNRLEWINDFVVFHITHHQAECIVIFDNGSNTYSKEDLALCLKKTGIQDFLIIDVTFPYGPILADRNKSLCFLQTCLLNLAKEKFFPLAGAVLSIDIDELVWTQDQRSIFELTKASWHGFMLFDGQWRLSNRQTDEADHFSRHSEHAFIDTKLKGCPTKYCYQPQKIARWFSLGVHHLKLKRTFLRKIMHNVLITKRAGYWHCRNISTQWKGARITTAEELSQDQQFITYQITDKASS